MLTSSGVTLVASASRGLSAQTHHTRVRSALQPLSIWHYRRLMNTSGTFHWRPRPRRNPAAARSTLVWTRGATPADERLWRPAVRCTAWFWCHAVDREAPKLP